MPAAEIRLCANGCGSPVEGNARALFCSRSCKTAFHNVALKRGSEIMAFLQVWRASRNYKSAADKDAGRYAFRIACSLLDQYNLEDKIEGRVAIGSVKQRMEKGWSPGDSMSAAKRKWFQENGYPM